MTALTWGLFMGVSSNVRYQVVFGLERVVDKTVARRVPQVGFLASDVLWQSASNSRQLRISVAPCGKPAGAADCSGRRGTVQC